MTTHYLVVRVDDNTDAIVDGAKHVVAALRQSQLNRPSYMVAVNPIDASTWASIVNGRDDASVEDFVSVEASRVPGTWDLTVYTINGDPHLVRTDTQPACEKGRQAIMRALRTWGGWK